LLPPQLIILSTPEWTPQILFELKYCPICEWF